MTVIHHLNCGTMCPNAAPLLGLVDKDPGHLVAHCLLIESGDGLVLLDTGFGTGDVASPKRLGASRHLIAPKLRGQETALARVKALGYAPEDVKHILITHLDLDHAGGLGDFPNAEVHLHAKERAAASERRREAKLRYRPAQMAHGPRWNEYDAVDGEAWKGFPRVRLLQGLDVEIALIPLHGHTTGHAGFAIDTGSGWLLHAGDAYLHHGEIATPPVASKGLATYHRLNSVDERARRANAGRLADLARDHGADVQVFCSHDAVEYARLA